MNATKFTFDTVFGNGLDEVTDTARGRRRRSLTEAEIEQLCAEARAEGTRASEVAALQSVAKAAEEVAGCVRTAMGQLAQERNKVLDQTSALALAVARKLAHAVLTVMPQADVEVALREAMHQAIGEPRLVIKASADVAAALAPRVTEIAHEEGFDGRVQISPDPALRRADCRIEWRGGGAERAESAIEKSMEELIARSFKDLPGAPNDEGADHGR
jgi:flagellar assembly protein FliH